MREPDLIVDKSMAFAVRIVNLYKYLKDKHSEYVLSKQVLRSGTSIGANVKEATRAQSKADFKTKYITEDQAESLLPDCVELIKILIAITKTVSNS